MPPKKQHNSTNNKQKHASPKSCLLITHVFGNTSLLVHVLQFLTPTDIVSKFALLNTTCGAIVFNPNNAKHNTTSYQQIWRNFYERRTWAVALNSYAIVQDLPPQQQEQQEDKSSSGNTSNAQQKFYNWFDLYTQHMEYEQYQLYLMNKNHNTAATNGSKLMVQGRVVEYASNVAANAQQYFNDKAVKAKLEAEPFTADYEVWDSLTPKRTRKYTCIADGNASDIRVNKLILYEGTREPCVVRLQHSYPAFNERAYWHLAICIFTFKEVTSELGVVKTPLARPIIKFKEYEVQDVNEQAQTVLLMDMEQCVSDSAVEQEDDQDEGEGKELTLIIPNNGVGAGLARAYKNIAIGSAVIVTVMCSMGYSSIISFKVEQ